MSTTTATIDADYLDDIEDVKLFIESKWNRSTYWKRSGGRWRASRAFGEMRGWTLAYGDGEGARFGIYPIVRGSKRQPSRATTVLGPQDLFDHPFGYKDAEGFPVAIVSYPYSGHGKRDAARTFASGHGLRVEFPDLPSFWYPGRTSIFVWTGDPAANGDALDAFKRLGQFFA
jgi:hypothetical protein